EGELHQPPTPTFRLESRTRFKLVAPHYVDFHFRCVPTQHAFAHGYVGLFWASYLNAPEDKSIYFRGGGLWQQLCTQRHNDQSTVRHRTDKLELRFSKGYPEALYRNLSPLRFDEPLYYGLFRNHIYILMFDRAEGVRFTHSPSGGGVNKGVSPRQHSVGETLLSRRPARGASHEHAGPPARTAGGHDGPHAARAAARLRLAPREHPGHPRADRRGPDVRANAHHPRPA